MAKRTISSTRKTASREVKSNEHTSQDRHRDYWTRELDALHVRMQALGARQAVDALFSATEVELNRRGI